MTEQPTAATNGTPPHVQTSTGLVGISFPTVDLLQHVLRTQRAVGRGERFVQTAQQSTQPYKAYVLLTQRGKRLRKVIVVKTYPDKEPFVAVFRQPTSLDVQVLEEGTTLRLSGASGRAIDVAGLPANQVRDIAAAIRSGIPVVRGSKKARHRRATKAGIATERNAPRILSHHVRLQAVERLPDIVQLMEDLARPGRVRRSTYRLAKGRNHDYLLLPGAVYAFHKDGRPATKRPKRPP